LKTLQAAVRFTWQEVTAASQSSAFAGSKAFTGRDAASTADGQKNKAVDAVYRQRPCQPRILKSAHAIR
jgi:hypothetical protein